MGFDASFGYYFRSQLLSKVDEQLCNVHLLNTLGLLFIFQFLDYTQGSRYYWHGGSFKLPQFFNLYFQVIVFTYFIMSFDCWL